MEDLNLLSKEELIARLKRDDGTVRFSDHELELEKLDKLQSISNPHAIPFRETTDHKNVMLYTALNKHVGPLHPDNARRTMERWKRAGFQLYLKPRTPEQIAAYMETDEYKKNREKHLALRKKRHQLSSKGRAEKMVVDVAEATARATAQAVASTKRKKKSDG